MAKNVSAGQPKIFQIGQSLFTFDEKSKINNQLVKKIEVKFDYKSQETGNILIELFMFNKPSALLATEADYWVIDTGKEIMWTTPKKILECILINNINSQKITGDGDTQAKIACLIPIKLFKKYTVNTF